MFCIVLALGFSISNVVASVFRYKKNYLETLFNGLSVALFAALVMFVISSQFKKIAVIDILYHSKMHIVMICSILTCFIIKKIEKRG